MIDLARRSTADELMDSETVDFAEMDRCLRDLSTINTLTLAYRPTLNWLDRVAERSGGAPLSILDVGCGHGDMLRRVWRWAQRRGQPVALTGIDINPHVIRSARQSTPDAAPIRYEVRDLFAMPEQSRYDVVINSLFAHHLRDHALAEFISWMDRHAVRSWLINDLHRHPLPYHFVRAWVRLWGFSRLVVHDAPISVARGFTRADWARLIGLSKIDPAGVEIRWWTPFRYAVGRLK